VYTRKSTDEGLEQGFNSLDAQREACEAFIRSQRSLGWILLTTRYDDGGLSGGTMVRPALRALLADIERRKVDLVVVYKVDRLTRSLTDFARMVDIFDAKGVSFVSVTQQFNTTTSMGRLTLNVLLSFAQFEREVTGERIRDKIAASKKKGMWMGGLPPLGYDVRDKKLQVNPEEAESVRTLFRLYLELGTVRKLVMEADRLGLVTKRRRRSDGQETGGQPFTRGHFYQLLTNPIYVGEVTHKGATYPGQHEAIVERKTFDAVRNHLNGNSVRRNAATNAKVPSPLSGLVLDETGDRICPTCANKKGRRYRYYVSKRLIHRTCATGEGWRLPAKELEDLVTKSVDDFLKDERRLVHVLRLTDIAPARLRAILGQAATAARHLEQARTERQRRLLRCLLHCVTIQPDSIIIEIKRSGLAGLVSADWQRGARHSDTPIKLIVRTAQGAAAMPDEKLIALLARAHRWFDELVAGKVGSARAIAFREGIDPGDLARTIQLVFLAPDIIEAILAGAQPVELTPRRLKRIGTLPLCWDRQRRLLGVPA
jgi:DNA invertase Pin-like site-specific DNA recombinase